MVRWSLTGSPWSFVAVSCQLSAISCQLCLAQRTGDGETSTTFCLYFSRSLR